MFSFYPCDLSFNGTTPSRGQIPSLLYYSSPLKTDTINGKIRTEIHARDTALKVSVNETVQIKKMGWKMINRKFASSDFQRHHKEVHRVADFCAKRFGHIDHAHRKESQFVEQHTDD